MLLFQGGQEGLSVEVTPEPTARGEKERDQRGGHCSSPMDCISDLDKGVAVEKWSDFGPVLRAEPTGSAYGQTAAEGISWVCGLRILEHGGAICPNGKTPVRSRW